MVQNFCKGNLIWGMRYQFAINFVNISKQYWVVYSVHPLLAEWLKVWGRGVRIGVWFLYSRRRWILQFLEECLVCASWSTSEVLSYWYWVSPTIQRIMLGISSQKYYICLILKSFFCKNNHPEKIPFLPVNLLITVAYSKPCQMYLKGEGNKICTGWAF